MLYDHVLDMAVLSNLLLNVDSPTARDTHATAWIKLSVLQRRKMNTLATPIAKNYTNMFQTDTHKHNTDYIMQFMNC